MTNDQLILEYLRIFLSWPLLCFAMALMLRKPIIGLLDRLVSVKYRGLDIRTKKREIKKK
jgi:hypothetical protein